MCVAKRRGGEKEQRAWLSSRRGVYHSASFPAKTCYGRAVGRRAVFLARPIPLLLVLLFAGACGRRATQADCQLIVDRSVEIQLKEENPLTDAKAIAKREAEVRAELDEQIKSCERDRRVTDKMMACVQSASTTAELDHCLR
jgi:hypothetical protein